MTLDLEIDGKELGATLSRSVVKALAAATDEALRYGSLGRAVKEAADTAAQRLATDVLADSSFRAEARKALATGLLRGIEARGEKLAKGMALQQALDLARAASPPDDRGSDTGEGA